MYFGAFCLLQKPDSHKKALFSRGEGHMDAGAIAKMVLFFSIKTAL
jgi:hypothetical protein